MLYKQHTACRVCNSKKLTPYLDLGMLPLSNNLAESSVDKIHNEKYPLKVLLCEDCGLSQLSIVIPPEVMFDHYVYRSSISQGYVDHCRAMAIDLKVKHNLTEDSFHIDIAGNDGALLQQFKEVVGGRILNIDPAKNLTAICDVAGIPTLTRFWNMETARVVLNSFEKADLVTATNVFAHVPDVYGFLEAVKMVLKETGVLVLEMPYLIDFINKKEFDTIYHEHLSYFSVYPITLLCHQLGLKVLSVSHQKIHGGSIRVTIGHGNEDSSVYEFVRNERHNYSDIERYNQFAADVKLTINNFRQGIYKLDGLVAGFAASAKGCVLLNVAGITRGRIKYITDETPQKIGKYSPGTFIPIVGIPDMMRNPPDYLVVLSWNFFDEIKAKCRKVGYKGKFVIGIPNFQIID